MNIITQKQKLLYSTIYYSRFIRGSLHFEQFLAPKVSSKLSSFAITWASEIYAKNHRMVVEEAKVTCYIEVVTTNGQYQNQRTYLEYLFHEITFHTTPVSMCKTIVVQINIYVLSSRWQLWRPEKYILHLISSSRHHTT